jgi:hypothetical protein
MVSYSDIHVLMLSLTFLTILIGDYMGLCLIFIVSIEINLPGRLIGDLLIGLIV